MSLTKSERATIAKQSRLELSRRSYADYFQMSQDYQMRLFPHTKLLCDALQPIADGERRFLIVEMPPQHGKSTTITETFPSYYLMKHPEKEVMVASYSDDLAQRFGSRNLAKFNEFGRDMYGLTSSPTKHTSNEWQIANHRGAMHSTTILGSATGKHSDLLIIDDPIKGMQDANSTTIRNKIWDEWQASFYSRLSATGSVIVIMTRWNVDDLAGRLLKEMALPWEEIKLPAIAEENDMLGREVGEPLCPFPPMNKGKEWAEQTMRVSGSKTWAALYQQRPVLDGGNVFKTDQVHYYLPDGATATKLGLDHDNSVAILPKLDKTWSSWDLTFTMSDTSDYVAGQTWGKQGANFYLLDRVHDRMAFNDQLKAIMSMHQRQPKASAIYIEDKANGSAIINTIRNAISGVIPVVPKGDKVTRANVVVPFFEAGNIYLPHPKWQPWVNELLDEWTGFPNMEHDDEVDSMTQALSREIVSQPAQVAVSHDRLFY
ncbi:phage terminase large subunit [Lentilactobacillus sp. SPB1-3]|uniref:Phage terminase large subunit n=1 Tax=Lentilactobacillus terminaliae TaxID=3003483 RepID=A0ACD5DD91_9LACO|nr:phage terminase large subunit [Lentilactobacillus sp. SPB1-3]MCZ0978079.1 phage terminase large subunit [Lentilactobacillus sp. SPB1-3]